MHRIDRILPFPILCIHVNEVLRRASCAGTFVAQTSHRTRPSLQQPALRSPEDKAAGTAAVWNSPSPDKEANRSRRVVAPRGEMRAARYETPLTRRVIR